jgi:hypothetical protein
MERQLALGASTVYITGLRGAGGGRSVKTRSSILRPRSVASFPLAVQLLDLSVIILIDKSALAFSKRLVLCSLDNEREDYTKSCNERVPQPVG